MVLKSVWKLPKLQAQTSQLNFEMTVHEDEHNLPVNANLSDTV